MAAAVAEMAVIIPSYGDPASLFRALESLAAQQPLADDHHGRSWPRQWSVQVVHSGPIPLPPPAQWPQLPVHWRLSSVSPRRLSAAQARNLAVRLCGAELLVFLDADCLAGPQFLASHLQAHQRGARVVSGPVLPGEHDTRVAQAEYLVEFATTRLRRQGGAISAPACNLSIRRSVLEEVGGFPELEAGEDVLLHLRLRRRGHRLQLHPTASVRHSGRQQHHDYRRHRRFIGAGLGQLTAQAEREGLFGSNVSPEYRMLRWICRSPAGLLLVIAKLFRLLALILQGDRLVLRLLPQALVLVLEGLWLEAGACHQAWRQEQQRLA
ncbi:MAG: hypothetical protein RLZZ624_921 [Cyanobacteriota bacterium]|jgi:glycosyltransferase involved in cell wall biosynthesis